MPGLFDTHAHFEGSAQEVAEALRRARDAGVEAVMAVGGSEALNAGVETAFAAGKGVVEVCRCVGWDRDQAGRDLPGLDYSGVSAVGEIGLDYHYSPETRKAQLELFLRQLELSRSLGLPVVVHSREADDDTLGALRETGARGILHCFTGSPGFCRSLLDLGMFISISGIVTFRLADNVRESALVVPEDRLLVETDSPFLAPVPLRGSRNEPANVVHTAKFLADLRGVPFEALAEATTRNARAVFGTALR